MSKPSVVAVIPARGGSKGLIKKNIQLLAGKPLIAWTIEAAIKCELVDRTIVSTDDEEILQVAIEYGAEVPFVRPSELAGDEALVEDVLLHAVKWLEEHEGKRYDILLYLQPTDPYRRDNIIHRVIQKLIDSPQLDTVFAGCPDHKNYWTMEQGRYVKMDNRGYLPRQVKKHIFREDTGIACATKVDAILNGKRIGENVDIISHSSIVSFIDIHSEFDLWLCNEIFPKRGILPNQ